MKGKIFGKHLGFAEAVATLVGTIIGAGVLAIPYAVQKAGFWTGVLNLVVLGVVTMFLFLFTGEIALRTKGKHQLTGYAEKYLGKKGKTLFAFSMIFGIYGALIAYIIGVGRSLSSLFNTNSVSIFNIILQGDIFFSVIFFIVGALLVYLGIGAIRKSELIMGSVVITVIILICVLSFTHIDASNLTGFNFSSILIPFGVILFALGGAVAVPEMEEELETLTNHKNAMKLLKKAIIVGVMIPVILYLIFSIITTGVCGVDTSEVATRCIGQKSGVIVLLLGNIFAIFAMSTSFLTLGLALKEMYMYDYKINKNLSALYTFFIPLSMFFVMYFFVREEIFFKTIGISGGIAATLEGILLALIFMAAKKKGEREPEYSIDTPFNNKPLVYFMIFIFVVGMIYTVLNFFGIV